MFFIRLKPGLSKKYVSQYTKLFHIDRDRFGQSSEASSVDLDRSRMQREPFHATAGEQVEFGVFLEISLQGNAHWVSPQAWIFSTLCQT
jgi:hypothetical protein